MGKRAVCVVIAGLLGAALATVPAPAAPGSEPSTGSFVASDFMWSAVGGGSRVVIAQGGTVNFSYPSGISEHNAHFTTGNPSSCVQTAGDNLGPVPPLPRHPDGEGWRGTCAFNTPGIYRFHCDVHPFMIGTVAVQASGTSAADSPLAGAASQAIHFAPKQRGATVRGSIKVSRAGQGGSLQVALVARQSDLGAKGSKPVTVGRLSSKLRGGRVKVLASLGRRAKNALARRGVLRIQVKLIVQSPAGRTARAARQVLLRR